jgi:hypothetical protein
LVEIHFRAKGVQIELSADAKTVHILTNHDMDVVVMGPNNKARVMRYVAGGSDSPPPTQESLVPATPMQEDLHIPDRQSDSEMDHFDYSTYHHRTGVLLNTDDVDSEYSGSFDSQSGEPTSIRHRRW